MNSESPFRISSTVLTVACILCGIAAASYLVPRFIPLRNSLEQTNVAANALQVNLSEFQKSEGGVHRVAASHQPVAASGRPLFPPLNPPAPASLPATLLKAPTAIQQTEVGNASTSFSRDLVQTTSIQRSASPWASEGYSVPQFYAPVTVHPVIVNIDNAGIIREISRVHERLDSLSAEASSAARHAASVHNAYPTGPAAKPGIPATDSSSQYRIHDEQTKQDSVIQQTATDHPSVTTIKPQPAPKALPTRLPTTPPQLIPSNPIADAVLDIPAPPLSGTPQTLPVPHAAPVIDVTPPPVAVPKAMPEIQFETTPRQPVPEIPMLELPAFEPEAELPGSLPAIEFSTELFPVPEPADALATPETEESLMSIPSSGFVEPMAYTAPAIQVPQPVWPDIATLADPHSPSAKRTTDPPFMNGRSERASAPQTQIANEPIRAVQRVSHTTQAAGNQATPCDCRNCAATRHAQNPAYRIRAITPSQALNRIKSALSL